MRWNRIFIYSVLVIILTHAAPALSDEKDGLVFDAPTLPWKALETNGDYVSEWRLDDDSRIRVFVFTEKSKKELSLALTARLGVEGVKVDVAVPFEINLGQRRVLVLPFNSLTNVSLKGALLSIQGNSSGVGLLCTAPVESFPAVFLECRRIAATIEIDKNLRAQAVVFHKSGLKMLETDPSSAEGLFQSAIKLDPSYLAVYIDLSRALLAQGQSAEMVAARLGRMLDRAPDGPDVEGMRQRLKKAIRG